MVLILVIMNKYLPPTLSKLHRALLPSFYRLVTTESGSILSNAGSRGLVLVSERTFTMQDVLAFAELSGDKNPIHLDTEYAKDKYTRPIVHGTLVLGHLSGMIAKEMTGALLHKLNITFKSPLLVEENITISTDMLNLTGTLLQLDVSGIAETDKRMILSGTVDVVLPKQLARMYKQKLMRNS